MRLSSLLTCIWAAVLFGVGFVETQPVYRDGLLEKKHVPNSAFPYDTEPPVYNVASWAKQLHLQQCAFVAVGSSFYAVFVEVRPRRTDQDHVIREYILGYCDNVTLSTWQLCSDELAKSRPGDCTFTDNKDEFQTRVHRRLCDVTLLQKWAPKCRCDYLDVDPLLPVTGFPTCFLPNMPFSICGLYSVCGLFACYPFTVNGRIHSVVCDPDCINQQPFCENPIPQSTQPSTVQSFWTDWSSPSCTDGSNCLSLYDEAVCINRNTQKGDIDCLGPGTSCCMDNPSTSCKCHVFIEDDTLKVIRTYNRLQRDFDNFDEETFLRSMQVKHDRHNERVERSPLWFGNHSDLERRVTFHDFDKKRKAGDDVDDSGDDEDDDDELAGDGKEDDILLEDEDDNAVPEEAKEKSELRHEHHKTADVELEAAKKSEDMQPAKSLVGDSSRVSFIALFAYLILW